MKMRAKILNLIQSTREGQEGDWREHIPSAQEGKQFSQQWCNVQVCLGGLRTEAGMPKWGLAGESWVLVPEGEMEQVSLCSWGRARIGLWICDHKATEPGLRNVTGSEDRDHKHENVSQSSFRPHLSQSSCPSLSDRYSLSFRGICHLEWKYTSSAYSS